MMADLLCFPESLESKIKIKAGLGIHSIFKLKNNSKDNGGGETGSATQPHARDPATRHVVRQQERRNNARLLLGEGQVARRRS